MSIIKKPRLQIQGKGVRHKGDMVNLQDLWIAAGSPRDCEPWLWFGDPHVKRFIAVVSERFKRPIASLTDKSNPSAIMAHWQIAMKYTYSISPDWAVSANEAIQEWAEEKHNPELKMSRAIGQYQKEGRDNNWIADKVDNLIQRKSVTSKQASLNAKKCYGVTTDTLNIAVTGMTAKEIKAVRRPKSGATRDSFSRIELTTMTAAEAAFEEMITNHMAVGDQAQIACVKKLAPTIKRFADEVKKLASPSQRQIPT